MRRISDFVEEMVSSRFVRQDEAEFRCEVRLALADWWRSQLVRLKPTQRNSSAVLDWKNVEEARRAGEWRTCYMTSFHSYRSLVSRIEFWWYPNDEKQFGEEVAKRLKTRLRSRWGVRCERKGISRRTGSGRQRSLQAYASAACRARNEHIVRMRMVRFWRSKARLILSQGLLPLLPRSG